VHDTPHWYPHGSCRHQVKHIHTVLKCAIGSTIKMGQLEGPRFVGHVVEMTEAAVRVRLELVPDTEFDRTRQSAGVCLLLGTPRPTMIKSICVVSATMGVDHILLVKVRAWPCIVPAHVDRFERASGLTSHTWVPRCSDQMS
jgi:16S rRNA U1498 N3-methylase RsmE